MSPRPPRMVSITFDDGFRAGAEVARDILANYRFYATFFIVTAWVEPAQVKIWEPYNRGRSHGTWDFWRQLSLDGHEIGSHTYSQFNFGGKRAMFCPWEISWQLARSKNDLDREISHASHTISLPWNSAGHLSKRLLSRYYSACLLGSSHVLYNPLVQPDRYRLLSWAPKSNHSVVDYAQAISNIPPGGWLILQLHSFDDEGWEPISRTLFRDLCDILSGLEDVAVLPVSKVIERLTK
jgi:peptidoglycan/xylan/chitin deacetylase (PgdA/CDA1 family)